MERSATGRGRMIMMARETSRFSSAWGSCPEYSNARISVTHPCRALSRTDCWGIDSKRRWSWWLRSWCMRLLR